MWMIKFRCKTGNEYERIWMDYLRLAWESSGFEKINFTSESWSWIFNRKLKLFSDEEKRVTNVNEFAIILLYLLSSMSNLLFSESIGLLFFVDFFLDFNFSRSFLWPQFKHIELNKSNNKCWFKSCMIANDWKIEFISECWSNFESFT